MSLNGGVEILKLARLLGAEPEQLSYLQYVEAQDIRDLREQATVVMFDADRQMLQRVASATKLIPGKLAAAIGQRAFGALLCARVTGLLEPARAVEIAGRLPTEFLAEVAVLLDPRRASRVIAEIPAKQIGEITKILAEREEFITMGGFVGHLPEASLRAAVDAIDDETLLLTAYVIEAKSNLGALVGLLSQERLESVIATAHELDLWLEALDVLGYVSEQQRGQLGDIAAAQDDDALDGMVSTAQSEGLWGDVLPVTRAMSPDSRARFAKLESIQARPVLEQIMDAAHEHQLWPPLVGFATELEQPAQLQVAELIAAVEDDVLDKLLDAIAEESLQAEVASIVSRLDDAERERFCKRLAECENGELLCKALEAG